MVGSAAAAALQEGRTAVFTAYNIPHRDCGQHSAGGATSAGAYRAWIGKFAAALGKAKAVVVLEPDAVAHVVDGCTPGEYHGEREKLLGEAIDRLKRQPNTKVYLDAYNPAWIKEPPKVAQLVQRLYRAGVARADGFALNVSNFQTDEVTKKYGLKLSKDLGGKHFVIDTSRNGKGPLPGAWCNPPGRALGTPPTFDTGEPALDAYLWVKRPGESDGTCGAGLRRGSGGRSTRWGWRATPRRSRLLHVASRSAASPGSTSPPTVCPARPSRRACTSRAGPGSGPSVRRP